MTYTEDFEHEKERETQKELVDSIISHADIYRTSECASTIVDVATDEVDAIIELMSVGIDFDVTSVQKLTVHQLMTLASYALDLRNSVVNSLKENHNLEYLAGEK